MAKNGNGTWTKLLVGVGISLLAFAVGYGMLRSDVAHNKEQIKANKECAQKNKDDVTGMKKDISYIKEAVDRIEKAITP